MFFDVEYGDNQRTVSISYENMEGYLEVLLFKLVNGGLPEYGDRRNTFHLNALNKKILPSIDKEEIIKNNLIFSKHEADDEVSAKLLKSAKELRLVLKHWDMIND